MSSIYYIITNNVLWLWEIICTIQIQLLLVERLPAINAPSFIWSYKKWGICCSTKITMKLGCDWKTEGFIMKHFSPKHFVLVLYDTLMMAFCIEKVLCTVMSFRVWIEHVAAATYSTWYIHRHIAMQLVCAIEKSYYASKSCILHAHL